MKTKLLAFLTTVIFLFTSSCVYVLSMDHVKATGEVVKEKRTVDSYNSIDVSSGIHVILKQTGNYSVEVEANENFLEYIIVEVKENTLHIKVENGTSLMGGTKNVYVEIDKVEDIEISSGASANSEGIISGSEMEVSVSSGARADLNIEAEEIDVKASSGAHINLEGKVTNEMDANASSGAHIKAPDFDGRELEASVSSGAHISVGDFKEIDASVSSGGHISYSGDPDKVDVNKSSGGNVSRR